MHYFFRAFWIDTMTEENESVYRLKLIVKPQAIEEQYYGVKKTF